MCENAYYPKIQFPYCLLILVALRVGPMVDIEGKIFEISAAEYWKMYFSWFFLGILEFYWEV